jgi:hypothetical protein
MFEFEIEAPKSLRISVVPSHTRIAVDIRLRVRSPGPVEFRKDGLNLGYRLYDAHSELLFEGRAFSTPTPFAPGHWAPLRLQIPVSCIRYDIPCRLSVDCVKEHEHWFSALRGSETNIEILYKQDDSAALVAPQAGARAGGPEEQSQPWLHSPFVSSAPSPFAERNGGVAPLLPQTFRMAAAVVSLDPVAFRLHCYRTILAREPEDEAVRGPIDLESNEEKIEYWRSFFTSAEFRANRNQFEKDTERRILASLGYTHANTLLVYGLRLEWQRIQDWDSFFVMLANCVAQNSFSDNEIDEILAGSDPQIRVFYESVVSLAAEFSVGLARLNALAQEVKGLIARVDRLQANTHPAAAPTPASSRRLRKDLEGADRDAREVAARRGPAVLESEAATDGANSSSSAAEAPSK